MSDSGKTDTQPPQAYAHVSDSAESDTQGTPTALQMSDSAESDTQTPHMALHVSDSAESDIRNTTFGFHGAQRLAHHRHRPPQASPQARTSSSATGHQSVPLQTAGTVPAMTVRLQELFDQARAQKHDITLIAGRAGLNRPVRWVHMVENEEIAAICSGMP